MIESLLAGGPVMIPLGLCSVVALAVFLERFWATRRGAVLPRDMASALLAYARAGQFDEARALCLSRDIALGHIGVVALDGRDLTRSGLKERMEEIGRREAAELERGIAVVGTIASIAPLLGLMGTVGGMIRTFAVIQTAGLGDVANLAGGISEALITTFAGLCVGIPALVGNRYLLSRVDRSLVELEEVSLELVDSLVGDETETAQ